VALLKGLSYDRNIVQFYGVCPQPEGEAPLLVLEYMAGASVCVHPYCRMITAYADGMN